MDASRSPGTPSVGTLRSTIGNNGRPVRYALIWNPPRLSRTAPRRVTSAGLFHARTEPQEVGGGGAFHSRRTSIRRRTNRVKDGGPPHFASQNRHPRGRFAVPDPARPPPDQASCLEFEEAKMSIEQQIEELRAELRACDEECEIAMIRAELAAALAQKAALEIALEAAFQMEN